MWNQVGLAALLAPSFYLATRVADGKVVGALGWALGCAVLAGGLAVVLIPNMASYTLRKGLAGRDLGKKDRETRNPTPEALGIVCGVVFMMAQIVGQLLFARGDEAKLSVWNAALLSICFMVLLGFADDVLDLPWRYKLILPTVASLPLLCTYTGLTAVVMPRPVRPWIQGSDGALTWFGQLLNLFFTVDTQSAGAIVELGFWYLLYMSLLAVFCTNAINIYAGINGLEAGQSLVIGCAILFTNLFELSNGVGAASPHLFSASLILPFLGVTVALLRYNLFPAQVFVGDTFCYFAGMTFAVSGILGHYSKTLLLFFLPQIFNFLYSCPQLFGMYPCPRHRLPALNNATELMEPSTFEIKNRQGELVKRDNLTLICLVLRVFGPMREETLTRVLLFIQVLSCAAGLLLRYFGSSYIY